MLSIIHSDVGKDLLVKNLNCRFGLKFVEIFELFCQKEQFLNLNNHTNNHTIALKLFVNPQFLILLF